MKKIIALLLVLVMVIGLVACGGKKDDKLTIAFVPKVEGQAWWDYVGEGVKAWAAEHPEIEVIYKGPAEVDAAAQVQIMTDMVNQGVDVLCFSANDPNACEEICKQARDKGIIVISTESASMTNIDYDVEAFNDAGLGAFLMDELAKMMGEEGEYITMVGSMTMESHNNWADAGVAQAESKYPNMTLVEDKRVSSESDAEVAYNKTKELIQKYPNLKGILGTSSFDAPGVARAIDELGLVDKAFTTGTGMPADNAALLKSGAIKSLTLWDPAVAGQAMISLAVKVLNGETISGTVDLGVEGYNAMEFRPESTTVLEGQGWITIDAENVDSFGF